MKLTDTANNIVYGKSAVITPASLDPPQTDVRYLRITTASSPSWVGWYEIEVFE